MTRYRYFLLSSVLQFPYSVNVQQYRFFCAPQALGFAPTLPPPHRKSCRRSCDQLNNWRHVYTHMLNVTGGLDTLQNSLKICQEKNHQTKYVKLLIHQFRILDVLQQSCKVITEQSLTSSYMQWLKWFCEARGGAHLTKPGWSKPHTHSNPTNLALFWHKITLYGFNQGGSYYCRGLK